MLNIMLTVYTEKYKQQRKNEDDYEMKKTTNILIYNNASRYSVKSHEAERGIATITAITISLWI
jgi:hypothetical protein